MTDPKKPSAKEQCIELIRKAVPESMELKEGCVVEFSDWECTIIGKQTTGIYKGLFQLSYARQTVGLNVDCDCQYSDEPDTSDECSECDEGVIWTAAAYIPEEHFTKILGRKLQIADVLIALNKKINPKGGNIRSACVAMEMPIIVVTIDGGIFKLPPSRAIHKYMEWLANFDLTKDAHNQEPEFYEFLLPLLSNQ